MANELSKRPEFEEKALAAKDAFIAVIPDVKVWKKEIGFALQILRGNAESFKKCAPNTIQDAVTNIALTGATLNPAMQQAFLIPRSVKGVLRCCLDFSYRGLIKLAVDSDSVYDMDATCVYENDEFSYEMGLNPTLKHRPTLSANRGKITGAYATAQLHHGIKKFIYINKADIDKARESSSAKNSPAWQQWYEEMARKTAIKRLYKMLPQTERMSRAIDVINEHEGLEAKGHTKAQEIMSRFTEEPINEPPATVVEPEVETPPPSIQALLSDKIDALKTTGDVKALAEWSKTNEKELSTIPTADKDDCRARFEKKRKEIDISEATALKDSLLARIEDATTPEELAKAWEAVDVHIVDNVAKVKLKFAHDKKTQALKKVGK